MNIPIVVEKQKQFFKSGATLELAVRIRMLRRLRAAIKAYEDAICEALYKDLGKSKSESYMCEVGLTIAELDTQIRHIRQWAAPKPHITDITNLPARSFSVCEPYGCVLVMSPWNYPFMLSMEPLIGAIAAGNCCVLKPSAYAPNVSSVIKELVSMVFPEKYVAVVEGGRAENAALLDMHFDYIFFTGGVTVGRTVMEKASAHLTPVTLELGGKSPCIVDRTADLRLAARRIAFGKYLNCGQTCVAPDYLLIDSCVKDRFIRLFIKEVTAMYGADALSNPDYGKIVNRKHFDRLCGLIDDKKTVYGGHKDPERLKISPTVMDNVGSDDAVMQEEIFGPILPIITFDRISDAFRFVSEHEKPLAAYLFTSDRHTERYFYKHISFGGGCVNDTIMHLVSTHMGFGGVGLSGMGQYHGKKSFDTFSHEKSILKKSNYIDISLRYQPYSKKNDAIIRKILG
jgi:aldehyde dehydrogenase (NAD+)